MAIGMRSDVTLLERSLLRIAELDREYGDAARIAYSTGAAVREAVLNADLVVGAVLIPGAAAPKLVTRDMLKEMRPGSVLVDIAIDQGGCFEASKPTTHDDPTYEIDGIIHYCVANMPGGVPRTSTFALNNATLPFVIALAEKGTDRALADDPHLMNGLNIAKGGVALKVVAPLDQKACTGSAIAPNLCGPVHVSANRGGLLRAKVDRRTGTTAFRQAREFGCCPAGASEALAVGDKIPPAEARPCFSLSNEFDMAWRRGTGRQN